MANTYEKFTTVEAQGMVNGSPVRILIDEFADGSSVSVWDVASETYLHCGKKRYTSEEEMVATIVKKCKISNICW